MKLYPVSPNRNIDFSLIAVAIFTTVFCSMQSCKKNLNDDGTSGAGGTGIPNAAAPVTSSIAGLIVDENNIALPNAVVKAGTASAVTDSKGYFRFNNINLDKYAALVTATATGYFKGYRIFAARKDNIEFIKIKLMQRKLAGTIAASAGGVVTLTDNSTVTFPTAAVINKVTGAVYNGPVKVFASPIDPTDSKIAEMIPGSFMGIDKGDNRVLLKSFGMLSVELEGSAGEALQLASGKLAAIHFSIPASLISSAANTIQMWYVDENTGIWKEEGSASKNGNFYDGTVSHFSIWNVDGANPFATMEMTIRDTGNRPLPNVVVRINRPEQYHQLQLYRLDRFRLSAGARRANTAALDPE